MSYIEKLEEDCGENIKQVSYLPIIKGSSLHSRSYFVVLLAWKIVDECNFDIIHADETKTLEPVIPKAGRIFQPLCGHLGLCLKFLR